MVRPFALCLSLLWPAALACAQPEPAAFWLLATADGDTVWESRGAYNGRPMALRVSTVRGSAAEWLARAQQALGASGPTVQLDGQVSVSGRWRDQLVTVAARDLGGPQVELTQWQQGLTRDALAQRAVGPDATWLAPDSAVFSDQRTDEDGVQVRMLSAGNTHSRRANFEYAERALRARGLEPTDAPVSGAEPLWSLEAEGAGEQARVTVADHGKYRSVVIWWRRERGT